MAVETQASLSPDATIDLLREGELCGAEKCKHPKGCVCHEIADLIAVLTARAEIAEEDAAEAWAEVVKTHLTYAKRGGDTKFAENRRAYLARQEQADARLA